MPLDAAMIAIDAKRQIMTGTLTPLTPLYLAAAKLGPKKGEVKKGAGKKGTGKKGTGKKGTGKKRTGKQDKNRAGGTG